MTWTKHQVSSLIDALGGTVAVANLFEIQPPSVSEWRRKGLPKARLQYLELLHPDMVREFLPELHNKRQAA